MYFVCTKWPICQDNIRTIASWASRPGSFELVVSFLGTGALFPTDTTPQRQDAPRAVSAEAHGKEHCTGSSRLGFHFIRNVSSLAPQSRLLSAHTRFFCRPPCLSHLNSCPKMLKTCSICSYPIILSPRIQGLAVNPFLFFHLPTKHGFTPLPCHFWQLTSYLRDICLSVSITLFPMGFRNVR